MKRIKWILATILFLQINVYATGEVSLNLNCRELTISKGEMVNCELMVNTINSVSINNISIEFEKSDDLRITYVPKNDFEGSIVDNKLVLNNSNEQKNSFTLGTLVVSLMDSATYKDKTLVLKNISFSNNSDLTKIYTSNNINKTFTVLSDNNNLKSIKVDGINLSNFASSKLEYNIDVSSESVTILGEKEDELASVKGNREYKLEYGLNTIELIVTSQSNKEKVYKLNINRIDDRSSVNTLKTLVIEGIAFNFKSNTNTYKINVKSYVNSVKINSTLMDENASYVEGFGNREVNLNYGNNEVLIKVLSENGKENTYTLNIVREDNRNDYAFLNNLVVNGSKIELKENVFEYDVEVYYKHSKTIIEANTSTLSKIEYNNLDLKVGNNLLIIKVISEKGTTNEYKINIERLSKENSKVLIEDIIVGGYNLNFSNNIYEYNLKVEDNVYSLDISVLPEEEEITYAILGNSDLENGSKVTINVKDDLGEYIYTINIIKDKVNLIFGIFTIMQLSYIILVIGFISFMCSLIYLLTIKKEK